jgi:hypothetical protein
VLSGCAGRDSGFDAIMRVDGAQFYRGTLPQAMDGPQVLAFSFSSPRIAPGLMGKQGGGNVDKSSTAVAAYLEGDPGYWIFTPGTIDPLSLDSLTFNLKVSFSPLLTDGKHTIVVRAANADGHFGPPATADLTTDSAAPPDTQLTVTLSWDTEADLDLHLVLPAGTVIWAKNINSVDPNQNPDWQSGGILDFDSNANCQIDGRRREMIYWTTPPPAGHYLARVDTYSLCGESYANWTVTVAGVASGMASGHSLDRDTAYTHDSMAGVTALQFDVN